MAACRRREVYGRGSSEVSKHPASLADIPRDHGPQWVKARSASVAWVERRVEGIPASRLSKANVVRVIRILKRFDEIAELVGERLIRGRRARAFVALSLEILEARRKTAYQREECCES